MEEFYVMTRTKPVAGERLQPTCIFNMGLFWEELRLIYLPCCL